MHLFRLGELWGWDGGWGTGSRSGDLITAWNKPPPIPTPVHISTCYQGILSSWGPQTGRGFRHVCDWEVTCGREGLGTALTRILEISLLLLLQNSPEPETWTQIPTASPCLQPMLASSLPNPICLPSLTGPWSCRLLSCGCSVPSSSLQVNHMSSEVGWDRRRGYLQDLLEISFVWLRNCKASQGPRHLNFESSMGCPSLLDVQLEWQFHSVCEENSLANSLFPRGIQFTCVLWGQKWVAFELRSLQGVPEATLVPVSRQSPRPVQGPQSPRKGNSQSLSFFSASCGQTNCLKAVLLQFEHVYKSPSSGVGSEKLQF